MIIKCFYDEFHPCPRDFQSSLKTLGVVSKSFESSQSESLDFCLWWGRDLSKSIRRNFKDRLIVCVKEENFYSVRELYKDDPGIVALFSWEQKPSILSLLKSFLSLSSKEETFMVESLDSIVSRSLEELKKVKQLHQKVVPLRFEDFGAIKMASKFAAGEAPGGEFFDMVKDEKNALVFLTSSSSYVASSLILSNFENMKTSRNINFDTCEQFLSLLEKEFKTTGVLSEDVQVHLSLLYFDLSKMKVKGYNFGGAEIVSSKNSRMDANSYPVDLNFKEKSYFEFTLERGERVLLLSTGIMKNNFSHPSGGSLNKVLKEAFNRPYREILNEIFLGLKNNNKLEFLKNDATAIYIEVDNHAIMEV